MSCCECLSVSDEVSDFSRLWFIAMAIVLEYIAKCPFVMFRCDKIGANHFERWPDAIALLLLLFLLLWLFLWLHLWNGFKRFTKRHNTYYCVLWLATLSAREMEKTRQGIQIRSNQMRSTTRSWVCACVHACGKCLTLADGWCMWGCFRSSRIDIS